MVKVQAIIREERLDAVVERLLLVGVRGLTIIRVKGASQRASYRAVFRGGWFPVPFISKLLLEWYGTDEEAAVVARVIAQTAFTGKVGDGRLFVGAVEEAIRIRTGERGTSAL